MRSAKRTTLCRALQSWFVALLYHTEMQWGIYGPWIESFQDCWWDPEFPQLSQMVRSMPEQLNDSVSVVKFISYETHSEKAALQNPTVS